MDNPRPTFKFLAIPTPPLTIIAPFVVFVESVSFVKYAIPSIVVDDESMTLVIINFSDDKSQTRIIPSSVLRVLSISFNLIKFDGGLDAFDKTRTTL